jgi:hypothetical protein
VLASTIDADEISGKTITSPCTLSACDQRPVFSVSSNHTEKEAFSLILATTAAGHELPPACFVQGKTDRVLRSFSALAEMVQFLSSADGSTTRCGSDMSLK